MNKVITCKGLQVDTIIPVSGDSIKVPKLDFGDVTSLTVNITGDVTGDLLGNVTGDVIGNVTGDINGNVTGNLTGDVTGDVTGNLVGDTTGVHTGDVHTTNLNAIMGSSLDANSFIINNLATPVDNFDATNKSYVDAIASGLIYKDSCIAASDGGFLGTYSIITMTITGSSVGALVIDGITPSLNDRILIKDKAPKYQNGIYVVSTVGDGSNPFVITRADDYNSNSDISPGDAVYVETGTVNSNSTFSMNNISFTTLDTDDITWSLISKYVSPLTTKGDIYIRNGTNDTRLPIGSTGEFLIPDNTDSNGVIWGAAKHEWLGNLLNDDHTQYALQNGRSGQSLKTDILSTISASALAINGVNIEPTDSDKFTLSRDTTVLDIQESCTINQELSSTSNVRFNNITVLNAYGGVDRPIDHYERLETTLDYGGAWSPTKTGNVIIIRIGNLVNITIEKVTGFVNVASSFIYSNALPIRFRHNIENRVFTTTMGTDNNANSLITVDVSKWGVVTFSKSPYDYFTVLANGGFNGTVITYCI